MRGRATIGNARRLLRRRGREAVFDVAARWTRHVTVEAGGLTFLVPTWDRSVGRRLFAVGRRQELRTLPWAVAHLRTRGWEPSGVFVDVGANIGTASLAALREGFDRVVAVEPEPRNVRLLAANAELNGMRDRVTIVAAAASSGPGRMRLRLHPTNSGGHTVTRTKGDLIDVPAVTVDDITDGDVGMLWIDAQGHEPEILLGARSLIGRVPTVIEITGGGWTAEARALLAAYRDAVDLVTLAPVPIADLTGRGRIDVLLIPH